MIGVSQALKDKLRYNFISPLVEVKSQNK